jgi:hypothetical protein
VTTSMRLHVLEALMPNVVKSQRAIAIRLNVNKNLMPEIVAKKLKFNELIVQKLASSLRAIHQYPANTLSIDGQTDSGRSESYMGEYRTCCSAIRR